MRLLVIRLSAMGDVALVVPALKAVINRYPAIEILMLTRQGFSPLFKNMERVTCINADVSNRHKGLSGLYQLYKEIKHQYKPEKVIDLHDVMRSWVLCALFKKDGIPFFKINKGRTGKKALTRKEDKQFIQLKHSAIRYLDVFAAAGYPAQMDDSSFGFDSAIAPNDFLAAQNLLPKDRPWIGVAPFARHTEKTWPLIKMQQVIKTLSQKGYVILLFGGGKEEIENFERLKELFPNVIIVAGNLSLTKELGVMRQLDVMITMDSANMHLAAISGIPVVSIWGATHSYAGFGPLNGNEKYIVQIPYEELPCRPCSVFGNKPCFRGDHACMEWIAPARVVAVVEDVLQKG